MIADLWVDQVFLALYTDLNSGLWVPGGGDVPRRAA